MSWLDDVIKKVSENTGINKAGEQIQKYATKMYEAQDKLKAATANQVSKARPEIERGLGQSVLDMVRTQQQQQQQLQMPGAAKMMAQGKAMDPSLLQQQIAANSQGEFAGQPSIMPEKLENAVRGPGVLGKLGNTVKSEGRMGTDKAGKGFGNDLYKFVQSIGYGMIDKPLGREANTWDYLGKTVGQIARLNEGSGLGAGQPIYTQERQLTPEQNKVVNTMLSNAPDIVAEEVKKGTKKEEALLAVFNAIMAELGVVAPKYRQEVKDRLGMKSGLESFGDQLEGAIRGK
jgi:hypothetical protein